LPHNGLIIMGNEGNGISKEVEANITKKLFIPAVCDSHVESLNISMAAAIVCNEFRRNLLGK
ncbi:MAG: RNA methyltransferase, partial [Bacteroidales bacterium]|nr:RNA methyltransferase [Bacteroidales bacterium]